MEEFCDNNNSPTVLQELHNMRKVFDSMPVLDQECVFAIECFHLLCSSYESKIPLTDIKLYADGIGMRDYIHLCKLVRECEALHYLYEVKKPKK